MPRIKSISPAAVLFLFVITLGPIELMGQYVEDAARPFWGVGGPSARAKGLGESFTGIADDESALYYNPAGLAHLVKPELNLGFDHSISTVELTTGVLGSGETLSMTRLVNMGFALPVPGTRVTWGAGFHQIRAFEHSSQGEYEDIQYIDDVAVDTLDKNMLVTDEGTLGSFSAGFGYQVSTKLAVGAALDIVSGSNSYTENITFLDIDSIGHTIITPDYSALSMSFGIMLSPVPSWRIGALLRTPQNISMEEQFSTSESGGWSVYNHTSKGPFYFRVGSSLSLGQLLVATDLYWYDYSQIKFESEKYDDGSDIEINSEINNDFRQNYNSVEGLSIGAEYLLPMFNTKIRSGYRHDPAIHNSSGAGAATTISAGFSAIPVPQLKIDFAISQTSRDLDLYENLTVTSYSVNLLFRL